MTRSDDIAAERLRCKTDLYYLASEVLGYDLIPEVHQWSCDLFVKKDPSKDLYAQDTVRNRLFLDPRGCYKTTLDIADTIQWLINFPNVRILFTSGTELLALRMLQECKYHFLNNEKFRSLFFEHAVDEKNAGNTFEFTTPARTNKRLREPSVSVTTIGSVKAGSHFDIIKFDDVVNEVNSQSREQLEKTIFGFNITSPLLEPGGYSDVIGTRYSNDDLYGWILDNNKSGKWRVSVRAASDLPLTPESKFLMPQTKDGRQWLDYEKLKEEFNKDPYIAGCQYYNDPNLGESSSFTEKLLREKIVPYERMPLMKRNPLSGQWSIVGKVFIAWDLAFGEKKSNDYTVGVAGCFDRMGRLYVVDMVRGRFSADELVYQFLCLLKKWYVFLGRVGVEDAGGSKLIGPALRNSAASMKIGLPIDWLPVNPKATKNERIFGLLPLLKNNRLFFNKDIPALEDIITEFKKFPRTKHDDILDAISMLVTHYQGSVDIGLPMPDDMYLDRNETMTPNRLGFGLVG